MTNEEAIEMLDTAIEVARDEMAVALLMAYKAVEKQIPRKLIHITRNEHCEKIIGYGCPACKTDVTGSGFYCWKCGQALDWSENDE